MEVLPNDLVRKCLLGVPYTSHDNLKAVCRNWEGMVSSPRFYADRKISGTSEQLICLIQKHPTTITNNIVSFVCVITIYDPLNGTWKRLTPFDDPHFRGISKWSQCAAVDRKLVIITGAFPSSTSLKTVYIYDFESGRWNRGADMPTPRSFFACSLSSSNGLVYVAGGIDENYQPLAAAETYNVEEDKWEILPPLSEQRGLGCQGVFLEDKFMVVGGREFDRSAEVFDPSAGTWRRWEDIWSFNDDRWRYWAASSSGKLYVVSEQEVMKYDGENNVWTPVGSLPQLNYIISCGTEWHDWIFVSTSGTIRGKHISYLFSPSTGRSIKVNSDEEAFMGVVVSATTIEI